MNVAACSVVQLSRCDVVRNQAPAGALGAAEGESRIEVARSILADHESGLVCSSALAVLDVGCSVVFGNGVDLDGPCSPTPSPDWIAEDPRFCGLPTGDLTLCANSPALTPSCATGPLGAHDQGCAACGRTAVRLSSWGALKTRYR
jgi:hypothetical protein